MKQVKNQQIPYFEVKNLTKIFKTGAGVKNESFTINKGQIVGFIGDNGAGKTTTIKLIFGEHKKDTGEVFLKGVSTEQREALIKIAFFPDQNNYPHQYKIKEYAYYCASLKGITKEYVDQYFDRFLEALSLEKFRKSRFDELSAGMQKRALLLATLVTDPEMIILDEPTANLDVKSRLEFMEVLRFLAREYGKTIMITSHNIDELNLLIDKVVLVNRGEIIYENDFDKTKENLRDVYMKAIGDKETTINYEKIKSIVKEESETKKNAKTSE
ncbi:ABC transporter ATP-binding protein [Mesoplasma seiffertii]|uniref:ABC transporter ATP-binding protein n=1 Tax=Mesoplasma seiffertii TaxID=28224 RepID=UPI0004B4BD95|nr:ABC transporter ATP-binding protein [Mesoplasma seiffertii]